MVSIPLPNNEGFADKARVWLKEEGVLNRATFTGMLLGKNKLAILRDADMFVLPSYSENFGISVVEAMACGVPVVISDKVNIWRDIQKANAGIVVPCEAKAVGSALLQLIEDPHRRHTMGLAGRDFVRTNYNWEKIGHQIIALYQNLIQSSST